MSEPHTVLHGDCREVLSTLPAASVHAVVTDPPYEYSFMGRAWDRTGIAFDAAMWAEVRRVLVPGGHIAVFGGPRTFHRVACALEDAGFELRDTLSWLFGQGFPKSLDVGKAIDREAGAEREVVPGGVGTDRGYKRGYTPGRAYSDAAVTEAARQWEGWGTALKPGWEPILLARAPFKGTVAANVLEHGTGAIHVAACRLEVAAPRPARESLGNLPSQGRYGEGLHGSRASGETMDGRWPANVALDEEAYAPLEARELAVDENGERFFYCAKASRGEREAGLREAGLREADGGSLNMRTDAHAHRTGNAVGRVMNHHPTVKPVALMRWLVRMVTPPGGLVLDPFTGSGTTGCAVAVEAAGTACPGARFLGIEQDAGYVASARARIAHWADVEAPRIVADEAAARLQAELAKAQLNLLGDAR